MDGYYYRKTKDSEQQTVYLIWLVIIAVFVCTWYCTYKWLTHKCPEPAKFMTSNGPKESQYCLSSPSSEKPGAPAPRLL